MPSPSSVGLFAKGRSGCENAADKPTFALLQGTAVFWHPIPLQLVAGKRQDNDRFEKFQIVRLSYADIEAFEISVPGAWGNWLCFKTVAISLRSSPGSRRCDEPSGRR